MNTIGNKKNAKAIDEANGKAIGYSKDACEECCKHKDDGVYIIAIDLLVVAMMEFIVLVK